MNLCEQQSEYGHTILTDDQRTEGVKSHHDCGFWRGSAKARSKVLVTGEAMGRMESVLERLAEGDEGRQEIGGV